jgi:two-component system cell cycle sensor histidine kinase/response regulator CckA
MKKEKKPKKSPKPARTRDSSRQKAALKGEKETAARQRPKINMRGGEARFLDILNNIETSYFEMDLKGNFISINNNVCRDLGYPREELLGMNFSSLAKEEHVDLIRSVYNEIYRTGKPKTLVNIELVRKDGSTIFVEQSACVTRGPSGEAIGFQGVARDITERILAEKALKRSEEKYRMILETIEDGYYETDLKGNFIFFNRAGWMNTGYGPDELMGMNYKCYTTPESAEFLLKTFSHVYETGRSESLLDYEVILKDGSLRFHEMSVGLLKDDSGQPSGFHILARDVTRRKEAEQTLRRSEEKYRTVLETMDEGFFEVDLKGNYTFCNDALCRMVGYEREELIGLNYRNLLTHETISRVKKVFRRIYDTGKPELLVDNEVIHKDGTIRTHQTNVALIRDSSGRPAGFYNLTRDVTSLIKAEENLIKSEEKYRTILDIMEEGYVESDLQGTVTFLNDVACRFLGYEREALIGKSYKDYHPPETVRYLKEMYGRIYETGNPEFLLDYKIFNKEGSPRIHQSNVALMRDPSGKPVGFRVLTRDVTKLKEAEENLRKSEERYRTILDIMEEGYVEADLRGVITFANDVTSSFLEYTNEELIGMDYKKLLSPDVANRLSKIYNRIFKTGEPAMLIEYEIMLKDGSVRTHQSNAVLMRDPAGKPTGFRVLTRDVTKQKKAEQDLKKSEEKYRDILDVMEEGLLENDLAGNIIFTNDAASRLLGYEHDELIGMNYRKIFSTDMTERIFKIYNRIYKTGEPEFLMDYETICKDGTVRILQSNVALIRDADGNPTGFRVLARDVTERKKAEEDLKKSEETYRNILDTMEEGYYEADLNGTFTFVNDAGCRLLGYDRDELIGLSYRDNHPPESARRLDKICRRIYETGKPEFMTDYEVKHKDGSIRIHQSNIMLDRDAAGKPIGFRTLARDVTEHKKAEDELKKSEEKYRTILEIMEVGYFEIDLKGVITFVNDAACKLTEFERHELIGRHYKSYHSGESKKHIYEIFHRIYETGRPEFLMEYQFERKSGMVGIHQLNVALLHDASGKAQGFRILAKDVTGLKNAEHEKARIEEQLHQAQKMESIGRLAGGVAHDFNNMLTVILGYAELIKSRLDHGDPLQTDIAEIEKAAARSRDLTRQLLAFSRKEIIVPKPVDLNSLIVGAQKALPRLIGEDIDLRFYPGTNLWNIKFDPSQMEHILINLSANARDAMPDGGKLTIETENIHLNEAYCKTHPGFLPGYYVLLCVSDDGIGMNRETMRHLYEPFFTTKEHGKGTGLGLATVYGIIKQNDGFINVYSEPGKGTTFKIYIPRSSEEAVVEEGTEEILPKVAAGTVLLIEDDEMVRGITTEMLEAIGYTVLSTGNPLEGLSFFERDHTNIDLVITDVVMPMMSGKELSERIEAIRPGVGVLFMSGYTSNVIAHRGVLDEGVYFIQKPFSISDLARKVREVVNGR